MNWRAFGELLKETIQEWNEDKASRLAAALAYYSIFSNTTLLIILIAIADFGFGEAAKGEIVRQIQGLVGEEGAKVIQAMIGNAYQTGTGTFATLVSIATLLLGATGIFSELQKEISGKLWFCRAC